jgi:ectoine hydroxylase-related dioxygenase (phytanoyl-CoA dioxygenase family)
LIAKGQEFRDLIVHRPALEYVRHVLGPDITLFSFSGNAIGPGAAGGGAHTDQIYMPSNTPWPVVCNVIYMLDDFTEDNGATLVVPGSHRRRIDELTPEVFAAEAVSATGKAGSALVMESRIFHSIGVNRTADVTRHGILAAYGAPFLRPQENWTFSTPRHLVEEASSTLRELLGFRVWRSLGGAQGPYGRPLAVPEGDQRNTALRAPKLDVASMDWGWVAPEPEYVGELAADGTRRAQGVARRHQDDV